MSEAGLRLPFQPPVPHMLAKGTDEIPAGEEWLYEPKWDGFRALVFFDGKGLFLQSRDLEPLGRYFPELETALPAVANTAGDGARHGACGILGGEDGLPHRYVLKSAGRPHRALKTKEVGIVIRPGDVLDVRSGGGGGYGDPAGRSAEERARDRLLGFVTDTGGADEAAPEGDRQER